MLIFVLNDTVNRRRISNKVVERDPEYLSIRICGGKYDGILFKISPEDEKLILKSIWYAVKILNGKGVLIMNKNKKSIQNVITGKKNIRRFNVKELDYTRKNLS